MVPGVLGTYPQSHGVFGMGLTQMPLPSCPLPKCHTWRGTQVPVGTSIVSRTTRPCARRCSMLQGFFALPSEIANIILRLTMLISFVYKRGLSLHGDIPIVCMLLYLLPFFTSTRFSRNCAAFGVSGVPRFPKNMWPGLAILGTSQPIVQKNTEDASLHAKLALKKHKTFTIQRLLYRPSRSVVQEIEKIPLQHRSTFTFVREPLSRTLGDVAQKICSKGGGRVCEWKTWHFPSLFGALGQDLRESKCHWSSKGFSLFEVQQQ